ncbi:MAG: hypothetical protein U0640_14945 [Phycisphaerales bacterium]
MVRGLFSKWKWWGLVLLAVWFLWPVFVFCWWTVFSWVEGDSNQLGAFGEQFGPFSALFALLAFGAACISVYLQREELKSLAEQGVELKDQSKRVRKILVQQKKSVDAQVRLTEKLDTSIVAFTDAVSALKTWSVEQSKLAAQNIESIDKARKQSEQSAAVFVELTKAATKEIEGSITKAASAMQIAKGALEIQAQLATQSSRELGLLVSELAKDKGLREKVLQAELALRAEEKLGIARAEFSRRVARLRESCYSFSLEGKSGIDAIELAMTKFREQIDIKSRSAWRDVRGDRAESNFAAVADRSEALRKRVPAACVVSGLENLIDQVRIHARWIARNLQNDELARSEFLATIPRELMGGVMYRVSTIRQRADENQLFSVVLPRLQEYEVNAEDALILPQMMQT